MLHLKQAAEIGVRDQTTRISGTAHISEERNRFGAVIVHDTDAHRADTSGEIEGSCLSWGEVDEAGYTECVDGRLTETPGDLTNVKGRHDKIQSEQVSHFLRS